MRTHRSRFALVRAGASCAAAGLLLMAACEAKVPTAAEMTSMDVKRMEETAVRSGAFAEARFGKADFFFDGIPITRDEARSILPGDIGSMTVVKGAARDTIFVVSKEQFGQLGDKRESEMRMKRPMTAAATNDGLGIRSFARTPAGDPGAQPTIMIDGVISTSAGLSALSPDAISSVSVRKVNGSKLDPRYPNGLIEIETKAHAAENRK